MSYVIGLFEETHVNELMKKLHDRNMTDCYTVIDRYNMGENVLFAVPGTAYASGATTPAGTAGVAAVVDAPLSGDNAVSEHMEDLLEEYDFSDEEKRYFAHSIAEGAYFVAVETTPADKESVRQMMQEAQAQHIHATDEDSNELPGRNGTTHNDPANASSTNGSRDYTHRTDTNRETETVYTTESYAGQETYVSDKPNLLSASTVIGDSVVNGRGETLGMLKEIMLHVNDGRIGYAVLAFDEGILSNVLGSNKYFAVPWSLLTLDAENHRFVLDIDRDVLENAPGFDKDNWPDFSHPYWTTEVTAYYID